MLQVSLGPSVVQTGLADEMKQPIKTNKKKVQGTGRASRPRPSSAISAMRKHAQAGIGVDRPPPQICGNTGDQQLATIYDHVSTILFSIAIEPRSRFRFVSVNQAFLDATGIGREQIVGRLVQDVIPEPSRSLVLKNYREAVRTKKTKRWEEAMAYPSGPCHGEVTVTPVCDSKGRITHLAGVVHDITGRKRTEMALQESEERYRRIVQTAEEGIWTIDAASLTDYVNPKMAQMMGYKAEEMIGRPIDDFLDDEGRAMLARLIKRRKGGIAEQFEFKYLRKDGSKLWAFVSTNPIMDAKGVYVGAMALLTDISARREAETAMRESEERYRLLADHCDDIVGLHDTKGNCLYLSPSYYRKTGWTPDDLRRKNWRSRIHPEDLPDVESAHRANLAGKSTLVEYRLRCKNGSWLWFETSCKPISGAHGKVWRLLVWSHDITERKLAEASYRRELKFNETLVNHTSVIIVLLDREGCMDFVNEATVKILGYSRKELLNRTPWDVGIMSADEKIRAWERLQVLLKGGYNPPRETILTAKNGEDHVFSLSSIATLAPDGTVDRIIVTGTDLTERNRMQREILRISEQEQARIGHNLHDGIGQTMTGVASLIEALEGELEGRQRSSAVRIRQLIQQAIQEVRRMSHSMSPAAVKNRGLGGVLQLLSETIRINHRTACACEVDPGIHLRDPEMEVHVYRIAQEAANNAVRHGKPAKITISLRHIGDKECVLKIEDNGSGISKTKAKISQGIGLQVMDYRANLIGGILKITSGPRGGVSVTCRFPCACISAEKP